MLLDHNMLPEDAELPILYQYLCHTTRGWAEQFFSTLTGAEVRLQPLQTVTVNYTVDAGGFGDHRVNFTIRRAVPIANLYLSAHVQFWYEEASEWVDATDDYYINEANLSLLRRMYLRGRSRIHQVATGIPDWYLTEES